MVSLLKHSINNVKLLSGLCWLAFTLILLVPMTQQAYAASVKIPSLQYASNPHFKFAAANATSSNWAGYVATGRPATLLRAKVSFIIPTLTGKPDLNKVVSLWAGMGGANSNVITSLVQAGVSSMILPADSTHPKPYQFNWAWFEDYPQPSQIITFAKPNSLRAGDSIYITIKSEPDHLHKKINDHFEIRDTTSNEMQSGIYLSTDRTSLTDGASAECIVERPSDASTGQALDLPTFGTASLSECQVSTAKDPTTVYAIANAPRIFRVDMINNSGSRVIAHTSGLTNGTDFTVKQ